MRKYLVIKKISDTSGEYPILGEIFTAEDYGLSISTIKYLISHERIVVYHEGM